MVKSNIIFEGTMTKLDRLYHVCFTYFNGKYQVDIIEERIYNYGNNSQSFTRNTKDKQKALDFIESFGFNIRKLWKI